MIVSDTKIEYNLKTIITKLTELEAKIDKLLEREEEKGCVGCGEENVELSNGYCHICCEENEDDLPR